MQHSTHGVTTTQCTHMSMLAVSTGAIALPAFYCGRVLDAWELPLLREHVIGRDRLHRERSEASTSAVLT